MLWLPGTTTTDDTSHFSPGPSCPHSFFQITFPSSFPSAPVPSYSCSLTHTNGETKKEQRKRAVMFFAHSSKFMCKIKHWFLYVSIIKHTVILRKHLGRWRIWTHQEKTLKNKMWMERCNKPHSAFTSSESPSGHCLILWPIRTILLDWERLVCS